MLERLIARLSGEPAPPPGDDPAARRRLAVAALLVEAVRVDRHADADERDAVVSLLRERFELPDDEAERLVELAETRFASVLDDWIFARAVRQGYDHDERAEILGMLWETVYSDGRLAAFEMDLLQRLTGALEVEPAAAEAARARAFARIGLREPEGGADE
ncbi:MAG: TerB family tellurite resistance protein [Burkholderiaceae bacterium]|nr:TerB family tellurite resistance protein [Burkholderiaceae bacterium]